MSLDQSVASSLDASPELLPLLPELLADLYALGSAPENDAELVASHVPEGAVGRILELGSGKGAVAIALARRLRCDAVGVEGVASFVVEANQRAAAEGLADRCHFVHGDLRHLSPDTVRADLVALVGVGPLFGGHSATAKFLARFVRPGGWLLIGDGFLRDGAAIPAGCESYADHDGTVARLESHGAVVVGERLCSPSETRTANAQITAAIRARAEEIAARQPELAQLVRDYVARQAHWDTILGAEVVCASWLLQQH